MIGFPASSASFFYFRCSRRSLAFFLSLFYSLLNDSQMDPSTAWMLAAQQHRQQLQQQVQEELAARFSIGMPTVIATSTNGSFALPFARLREELATEDVPSTPRSTPSAPLLRPLPGPAFAKNAVMQNDHLVRNWLLAGGSISQLPGTPQQPQHQHFMLPAALSSIVSAPSKEVVTTATAFPTTSPTTIQPIDYSLSARLCASLPSVSTTASVGSLPANFSSLYSPLITPPAVLAPSPTGQKQLGAPAAIKGLPDPVLSQGEPLQPQQLVSASPLELFQLYQTMQQQLQQMTRQYSNATLLTSSAPPSLSSVPLTSVGPIATPLATVPTSPSVIPSVSSSPVAPPAPSPSQTVTARNASSTTPISRTSPSPSTSGPPAQQQKNGGGRTPSPSTAGFSSNTSSSLSSTVSSTEEEICYVDVEAVDESKAAGKERKKAHIDFFRKLKNIKTSRSRETLVCALCEKTVLKNDNDLCGHIHSHAGAAACYRCKMCGWEERNKTDVYEHLKQRHPGNPFAYEDRRDMQKLGEVLMECFPRTASKVRLNLTLEVSKIVTTLGGDAEKETSDTMIPCGQCSRQVALSKESLLKHVMAMHPIYKCRECKLLFQSQVAIASHAKKQHEGRVGPPWHACSAAHIVLDLIADCFTKNIGATTEDSGSSNKEAADSSPKEPLDTEMPAES